jgi:nitrogen-specific signal transduction histidine kinase
MSLFEHVASGVARASQGVIRYANPACARLLPCQVGQRFAHPLLDDMTRAAGQGFMQLPLRFELTTAGFRPPGTERGDKRIPRGRRILHIVVTSAPWYDDEVLVFMTPRDAGAAVQPPIGQLLEQIHTELGRPLEHLIKDLAQGGRDAPVAARRATLNAQALHRKLGKVGELAASLQSLEAPVHERMLLHGLLDQAIEATASLALGRGIRVSAPDPDPPWPAVYGSQLWLSRAMAEFMEHAIHAAAPGGLIKVSLQVTGARASIRASAAATPFESIGLALCRQIVEQHGGSVRIEAEFDTTDLVIELPVGAPATEDMRLAITQAERFARSVSDLRARGPLSRRHDSR